MSVAYVLDEVFAKHRPPGPHPERPERLLAVRDAVREIGIEQRARRIGLREAREDELARVHTQPYLAELERTVPGNSGWLDGDTYYSPDTWRAVLCAAGAAIDVTAAVLDGSVDRGLVLTRPPGHHAEADRAMGFCLLNNIAVAAAAARAGGVSRVAVFDWDVHHGNGTQHTFESDPDVLFTSMHQYPFYPGTGAHGEVGTGDGIGATVNVPLPAGCGDAEYARAFDLVVAPALRRHAPELILISGGFDSFADDPLGEMAVTVEGFGRLANEVCAIADDVCGGRVVCMLEGGYDLGGLGASVAGVFEALCAERGSYAGTPSTADVTDVAREAIEAAVQTQADVAREKA